jgi:hypothetical protein
MTTIINSPPTQAPAPAEGGSGFAGILIGVVLVVIIGFLFFVYGLPAMRNTGNANTGSGGPTINVPDKVQVEIKK